jgi:hypothetical protein
MTGRPTGCQPAVGPGQVEQAAAAVTPPISIVASVTPAIPDPASGEPVGEGQSISGSTIHIGTVGGQERANGGRR